MSGRTFATPYEFFSLDKYTALNMLKNKLALHARHECMHMQYACRRHDHFLGLGTPIHRQYKEQAARSQQNPAMRSSLYAKPRVPPAGGVAMLCDYG
jgi:hypothetical protein